MQGSQDWKEIVVFWFDECAPEQWFEKDDAFDGLIRSRFLDTFRRVVSGETAEWRSAPQGRLAEVIVLDQFARNMFRDTPQAFAHDQLALALAQEAVRAGDDTKLPEEQRHFLYMPYTHSELAAVHEDALKLFQTIGGDGYEYELKHKEIIDRFGRYPHRNKILGRASTPDEEAFLANNPGF
jgi:uncharacterized protein (DUF924 family)